MLNSHLRELEADGIVHRVSYDEVPPRVEDALTEDGMRLNDTPAAAWGHERPPNRGLERRRGSPRALADMTIWMSRK